MIHIAIVTSRLARTRALGNWSNSNAATADMNVRTGLSARTELDRHLDKFALAKRSKIAQSGKLRGFGGPINRSGIDLGDYFIDPCYLAPKGVRSAKQLNSIHPA
jgi:hypothetical protein